MTRYCKHVDANGRRCTHAARKGSQFCPHHTPSTTFEVVDESSYVAVLESAAGTRTVDVDGATSVRDALRIARTMTQPGEFVRGIL